MKLSFRWYGESEEVARRNVGGAAPNGRESFSRQSRDLIHNG